MASQEDLTALLEEVIRDWPRQPVYPGQLSRMRPLYPYQPVRPVAATVTPAALAEHLLARMGFRVLQLGTWLQTPDGEMIEAAVEALSPPPLREDIELLSNAVKLAANTQRGQGLRTALVNTLVAAFGLMLIRAVATG